MPHRLLLVDDEPFNLELMTELLETAGYETVCADNGEQAWQILQQQGCTLSMVLLDKMMPGLNGFDVLKRIKNTPELNFLPVIMQTAIGSPASVQQGMEAGAFYYLTKPFSRDMLLAVVKAAQSHWDRHQAFRELAKQHLDALAHLQQAEFRLRTLKEAQTVTALLARTCTQPEKVATGLFELMVNAIEHGNLGISYADKTRLQSDGGWEEELERRQHDPVLGQREVRIFFERDPACCRFTIQDMGDGFDWQNYQDCPAASLLASHGRGILIARKLSFDNVEYQGNGNRVVASVLQTA
ncbi:probable two-component response regulator [Aquitalea magnusonii]|uniref:Probable two-component response regulator n=1 Tax=Aquitalea magnusonii TaxID=332411 RepID=A0A3G9GT21_9NEIS|nr:response regulator [Aquitalea magnusonii]BBF88052.1 probable two-component response regulator [Aquitalea magnusonii]